MNEWLEKLLTISTDKSSELTYNLDAALDNQMFSENDKYSHSQE